MSSQEATQRGDLEEVKTELERDPGAINDTDEDGYTACMFGAARGYADIVEFLIRNRADPNIQISAGSPGTPGGAPSETVRDAFLAHGLIQALNRSGVRLRRRAKPPCTWRPSSATWTSSRRCS